MKPPMTIAHNQPMSTSARQMPRMMLSRILGHHEIATLLLLLYSPIDVSAKPEIPLLQEKGLIEPISADTHAPQFQLTPHGSAVLHGLGLR
jgi:hypothetical protein